MGKGNTVSLKSNDAVGLCGPVTDRTAEYFGYILQVREPGLGPAPGLSPLSAT